MWKAWGAYWIPQIGFQFHFRLSFLCCALHLHYSWSGSLYSEWKAWWHLGEISSCSGMQSRAKSLSRLEKPRKKSRRKVTPQPSLKGDYSRRFRSWLWEDLSIQHHHLTTLRKRAVRSNNKLPATRNLTTGRRCSKYSLNLSWKWNKTELIRM